MYSGILESVYGRDSHSNHSKQIDQLKTELKTEMMNINFPLKFEQIQKRENIEITNIFVKRVCRINNNDEALLDDNFVKMWKEFHKN